jgi:hypothetical protein
VRAARLTSAELAKTVPADLVGAVLLEAVRIGDASLAKGTRLDPDSVVTLVAAACDGSLTRPVKIAWPGPDDVHEDEAASRLALAVGGAGIDLRPIRQSRLDLAATWSGVLYLRTDSLRRLNAIDPLEVFTLLHGQAVEREQVVASVKVAPHVLPAAALMEGLQVAKANGPIIEVRPYQPLAVGAIVVQALDPDALARFAEGARRKVEALGGIFDGVVVVPDTDPQLAEARVRDALEQLAHRRRLPVMLVGGVSAGDPIAPFYSALEQLGGIVLRRGVPAHPGSMIWLARLDRTQILGLPQCGMFSLATAADLILPRLLTGEVLTAEGLADLAHGGLLGKEMRFRMPSYARDLGSPDEA